MTRRVRGTFRGEAAGDDPLAQARSESRTLAARNEMPGELERRCVEKGKRKRNGRAKGKVRSLFLEGIRKD